MINIIYVSKQWGYSLKISPQ